MLGAQKIQEMAPLGIAYDDCAQDPCIHVFHVYAILDFELGDFAELGCVEFVLSELYPLPIQGKALLMLCVVQGSRLWYRSVVGQMNNWLARNPWVYQCSCPRRMHGLSRRGAAPPIRWRCSVTPGAIWTRCCLGASALDTARSIDRIQSSMGYDLVGEYHAMIMQGGYDVSISFSSDEFGKTCLAKYLHSLECVEMERLKQILIAAASGPEQLDFRCEFIINRNYQECNLL